MRSESWWVVAGAFLLMPLSARGQTCEGDAAQHNPCCFWKTDPVTCQSTDPQASAPQWPAFTDSGIPLNKITDTFGPRNKKEKDDPDLWDFHAGIDIRAGTSTAQRPQSPSFRVFPAWPGTVADIRAECFEKDGWPFPKCKGRIHWIAIKHELDGRVFYTRYLHLDPYGDMSLKQRPANEAERYLPLRDLEKGDPVGTGDLIGWTGNTGNYPPHLHFELAVGGYYGDSSIHPLRMNGLPYAYRGAPTIEFTDSLSTGWLTFWVESRAKPITDGTEPELCKDAGAVVACNDQHHLNRVVVNLLDDYKNVIDSLIVDYDRRTNSDGPIRLDDETGKERVEDGAEDGVVKAMTTAGAETTLATTALRYGAGNAKKSTYFAIEIPASWKSQANYKEKIEINVFDTWSQVDGDAVRCEQAPGSSAPVCRTFSTKIERPPAGSGNLTSAAVPGEAASGGDCIGYLCIVYPEAGTVVEAHEETSVAVFAAPGVSSIKVRADDVGFLPDDADGRAPWVFKYVPKMEGSQKLQVTGYKNGVQVVPAAVTVNVTRSTVPPELWFGSLNSQPVSSGDGGPYPLDPGVLYTLTVGARDVRKGGLFPADANVHSLRLEIRDAGENLVWVKNWDSNICIIQGQGAQAAAVCSFAWTLSTPGLYSLTATAIDLDLNETTDSFRVLVLGPTSQPTISFVNLPASVGESFAVKVKAVHPAGSEFIGSLSLEDRPVGSGASQTITSYVASGDVYTFNVQAIGDGQRTLTARFQDTFRNVWVSTSANVTLVGSGRIAGSVKDGQAVPLGGLRVYIDTDASGSFSAGDRSTTTGSDGSYAFNLIAGSYPVRVVTVAPRVVLSPTAEVQLVSLGRGEQRNGVDFRVGLPQGRIDGTVRGDDGSPRSGIAVYLDTNGNSAWDLTEPIAHTDTNGGFALAGLRKGTYRVGVIAVNSAVLQPTGGFHSVVLAHHSDAKTVAFTIGLGRVEGIVRAQTGRGLGGVKIYIDRTAPFGSYQSGEPTSTSLADGTYSLRNVAFGAHNLRVVLTADITAVTSPASGVQAATVSIAQPIRSGVDFTVSCGNCLQIRGTVRADVGDTVPKATVPGATVYLDNNKNRTLDAGETQVQTDASGAYVFGGLTLGSRRDVALVLPPSFNQLFQPAAGFHSVYLQADQDVTGVDFLISAPPSTPAEAVRLTQDLIKVAVSYPDYSYTSKQTNIPVKDWVCTVGGFKIDNETFGELNRTTFSKRVSAGDDGYWYVMATVANRHFEPGGPGVKTVELICLSRQVASIRQTAKPFFRRSFLFEDRPLTAAVLSLGIDSNLNACELAGVSVTPSVGNTIVGLDTQGAHTVRLHLERRDSMWHLRKLASVRTSDGSPAGTFDIDVDVLCAARSITEDTMLFAGSGSFTVPPISPDRKFFTSVVNGAGDNVNVQFEGLDGWQCGLGGFLFTNGDLNEQDGRALLIVHRAYYDGDKWHMRADVRSHGSNEQWTLPFFCLRRADAP